MLSCGLAVEGDRRGQYRCGTARIHLPSFSSFLPRHLVNWRIRAIKQVDRGVKEDLFYSGPVGISLG